MELLMALVIFVLLRLQHSLSGGKILSVILKKTGVSKYTTKSNNYIKGYCTFNQKLACFVLYLNIINILFLKMIYASYIKLFKELKNSIKI